MMQSRMSRVSWVPAVALLVVVAFGPGCDGEAEPKKEAAANDAANAWAAISPAKPVLVRAADAIDLENLMMKTDKGLDGATLLPGEQVIGCKDRSVGEDDRREHAAALKLEIPRAGTYYPWVRVWWLDSCANSVQLVILRDGKSVLSRTVEDSTLKTWHWLPVNEPDGIALEKGVYAIKVINTEDGAWLSGMLFSPRPYSQYVPQRPEG